MKSMKSKTVLTNGVVELDVCCNGCDAKVDLGDHILGQDKNGRYYIDGIRAKLITKIEYDHEWDEISKELR